MRWFDNARTDNLNNVIPPMPTVDPYAPRNTFTAVPIALTPPGGMSIASAEIEFGYAEKRRGGKLLLHLAAGSLRGRHRGGKRELALFL